MAKKTAAAPAPKTVTTPKAVRRPAARATKVAATAPVEPVIAAPVEAPVEAPAVAVMSPVARIVARLEFEAAVRHEAYLLAQRRGFRNGTPFEDWVRAEAEVHARLVAEGATLAG